MVAGLKIERNVPLAPLTTLELGGSAEFFVRANSDAEIVAAFEWAQTKGAPVAVLGGGSNVWVPDEGVEGLTIQIATRGISIDADGVVEVAAGEPWDGVVAQTVAQGLGGLECLSGIPGLAGATPIQNVGAYGQEVSDTVTGVRVLNRNTLEERMLTPGECDFSYRNSALKNDPSLVVLSVRFALTPNAEPTLNYGELVQATGDDPTLASVRQTVLDLRRRKSMVIEPDDPNRRSAGSFFLNPIVPTVTANAVIQKARALGIEGEVPRYDAGDEQTKLAAGWLIEKSGVNKGMRRGAVGVSTKHALALVHHGQGNATDLLALANEITARVDETFGVQLRREPRALTAS